MFWFIFAFVGVDYFGLIAPTYRLIFSQFCNQLVHSIDDLFCRIVDRFGWQFGAYIQRMSADANETLTLPHFDRHNGETAKKRALKNRRQAKWRQKSVDGAASTIASTREEKRREDIKEKVNKKKFRKPSLEEVTTYCHQRSNHVDPKLWLDHYTANGWMVGKNLMKDWKASVRTWERNPTGTNPARSGNPEHWT